jgi:transcriptional regulator with XRE-family HTH domain
MATQVRSTALRRVMTRRNLSQCALARLVGVSPSSISLWLRGRRHPGATVRARLLALLGLDFDALFVIRGNARRGRREDERPTRTAASTG